jgi:hypothetical protein
MLASAAPLRDNKGRSTTIVISCLHKISLSARAQLLLWRHTITVAVNRTPSVALCLTKFKCMSALLTSLFFNAELTSLNNTFTDSSEVEFTDVSSCWLSIL